MKIRVLTLLIGPLLDILNTTFGLRLGAQEEDPIMALFLHRGSEPLTYEAKLRFLAVIVGIVCRVSHRYAHRYIPLFFSALPEYLVVVNNLFGP